MSELLMRGTYGSYQTDIDPVTGQFANIRIIDAAEIGKKLALVVIKHNESDIETRIDEIDTAAWKYIFDSGVSMASKHGLDFTRDPFHQFIAKAYWFIIK
ncbi:MAG: hypothetical protein V7749_00850 [Cocleimonas sp.]